MVANPLKSRKEAVIRFLARQYLKILPSSKFVTVSGDGASTAVILSHSILRSGFVTLASTDYPQESYSDILTNISSLILKTTPKIDKVIVELKFKNTESADLYLKLLKPQTVIVGKSQDQLLEQEILKLIGYLPAHALVIFNGDDVKIRKMVEERGAQSLSFGTDQASSVWAGKIRIEDFQTIFELNYGVERVEIRSKLFGLQQIYPMLAAASLAISLDIPLISIKKGLEGVTSLEHRMQPLIGYNDSVIIDDSFGNNFYDYEAVLENLNQVSARRRIVVLSELKNSQQTESLYTSIARKLYKDKVDLVLLTGSETRVVAEELGKLGFLPERVKFNLNNSQIVTQLLSILSRGDIVLIKGDPAFRLDEVVKRVTKSRR